MNTLPTEAGLYFWREYPTDDWEILETDGQQFARMQTDCCYWRDEWNQGLRKVGEWIPVQPPSENGTVSPFVISQAHRECDKAMIDGAHPEYLSGMERAIEIFEEHAE